jgi:chromatin segregation and condensation protein Rec8/ScpA/Scc1 (kleisin family)
MKKKPYYLRSPWDVLFKITKLEKVDPWEIDLAYILMSLLKEMYKEGLDFRLAGTAVNSSGIIYLKKAELLLKLQEPPPPLKEKKETYLPPPIMLPHRFELPSTTLKDLIIALEKALLEDNLTSSKPKVPILPEPILDLPEIDQWLVEIGERAEELLMKIKDLTPQGGEIFFSKLVEGSDRFHYIRTFLLILFLAQRGDIDVWQEDSEDSDITIQYGVENNEKF